MADQKSQQPQQGGLTPSAGQKAAVDQFVNQAQPFAWLHEIIQRIAGGGQPATEAAPANGTAKGKKSEAQPQQPAAPGMTAPGQVQVPGATDLASVVAPDALQQLGLAPQTQGDFAWVLQAMQHAHDVGMQKGGSGIVAQIAPMLGLDLGTPGSAPAKPSAPASKG